MTVEKVTIGFNESNIADALKIKVHMGYENKAQAVGFALTFTEMLLSEIRNGNEVLVRNKSGGIEKITVKPNSP